MSASVVTRFAPSPTGYLHLGGLRTALYAYIWAKKNKGIFIVRLEDTDRQRFVPGAEEKMLDVLKKLGLHHDQYFRQSDRLKLYQETAEEMIDKGLAYRCSCSSERLDTLREQQLAAKQPPKYDEHCRELHIDKEQPHVVRFKIPHGQVVTYEDVIRGKLSMPTDELDDFVLLKSDGWPTYHLAMLVDDHSMGITHVIRAEEWLPSLPRHILMYDLMGYERPTFIHLPLLLNPDKSKLSKRQGDVAVEDYLTKGYLPAALINYVSLLGWHPADDREFFTLEELISEFDLGRLQKSGAVFDREKLNWYNAHYIRTAVEKGGADYEHLLHEVELRLPQWSRVQLDKIMKVYSSRLESLDALTEATAYLWQKFSYEPSLLIFKKSDRAKTVQGLNVAQEVLSQLADSDWAVGSIEIALKKACESQNLGFGDVFWPVRVSLSGREQSPSPAELAWVLGKEATIDRLAYARKIIESMV